MAEYEKAVKNFAHQVVAMAEKKEQDDKSLKVLDFLSEELTGCSSS